MKFGSSNSASSTGAASTGGTVVQHPTAQAQRPAAPPAGPSPSRGFGGGIPPHDPNAKDTGGDFEKRDAAYWESHPIAPGSYTFDCYVSKIVWWADGGISVMLRVTQWDRAANRPGEHHQREFRWDQTPGKRTGSALNRWRDELIRAYQGCGYPDEHAWPKDGDKPCPPWHEFFVYEAPDGRHVPIVLTVRLSVTPPSERGSGFTNIKSVSPIAMKGQHDRVQAPLPYEVPADIATFHNWRHGDPKHIAKDGRHLATVVPIDKDCVPLGHLGMSTYKDL
jgi:hypothetical protein